MSSSYSDIMPGAPDWTNTFTLILPGKEASRDVISNSPSVGSSAPFQRNVRLTAIERFPNIGSPAGVDVSGHRIGTAALSGMVVSRVALSKVPVM